MKTLDLQTPLPRGERERERGEQRSNSPTAMNDWYLPLLVGLALAVITAVPYAYAYAT